MGGAGAKELYDYLYSKLEEGYSTDKVKNGVFQAMMEVALVNDGPVSLGLNLSRPERLERCVIHILE